MSTDGPLSQADCAAALGGLSRETLDRLETYLALLAKWQKAINLVGPKTLTDPWRRHILDSAQLARDIPPGARLADLGSGAGLPGLVLAIVTGAETHLVESDQRKATFLREAARETGAPVTVHAARIEDLQPLAADIVTARALAPLERLLPMVHRHLKKGGKAILLKGRDADEELTLSAKNWKMETSRRESLSGPSGALVIIEKLAPADVC